MNEDKSKLKLIGEIAQANNKNLELIQEINELQDKLEAYENMRKEAKNFIQENKNKTIATYVDDMIMKFVYLRKI